MNFKTTLSLVAFTVVFASCEGNHSNENVSQTTLSTSSVMSQYDVNLHPVNKTVCDPFGGPGTTGTTQGIQASLYYLSSGDTPLHNVEAYYSSAHQSDQSLYFSDMNVPTRLFSAGFSTQSGGVLNDDSGNMLIEYFALKFQTNLVLGPNDDEGDYELALLSDDGTILKAQLDSSSSALTTIINNDGDHPTEMGCASQTIHMTKSTSLPITVEYYQGPRYEIANVLVWRKASVAGKDPSCGLTGNSTWFDPNNNSKPMAAYNSLLTRGWAPLVAANFQLPSSEVYNPCVTGTNPVISNFTQEEMTYFMWTTDILSTSQLMITNVATGAVILTTADNTMVLSHSVQISGLSPATTYQVQAVSISADLGKTISDPITITTP